MKRKFAIAQILTIILIVNSCIPSLHPLYHDEDRILMDKILGSWVDKNSPDEHHYFEVNPDDSLSYLLHFTENNNNNNSLEGLATCLIEVNLVKFGDHYFADFYPGDNEVFDKMNDMLRLHLIGVHTFAKLEISQDTFIIHRFDPGWIEKLIDENRIRISYEWLDDQAILTASTEELQKFVIKYADDPDAFVDPEILIRNN